MNPRSIIKMSRHEWNNIWKISIEAVGDRSKACNDINAKLEPGVQAQLGNMPTLFTIECGKNKQ